VSEGFLLSPEFEDLRWWLQRSQREQAEALLAAFRRVEREDLTRLDDLSKFTRIYENRDYLGMSPHEYSSRRLNNGTSVLNITQSVIDSIAAKISKTRPHSRFQTEAGNRSLRRKARLMERWVDHRMTSSKIDRDRADLFLDAAVTGTGIIRHETCDGEPGSKRVWPGDIFVDGLESFNREPSQLYQRSWVDRGKLIQEYPKYAKQIAEANPSTPYASYGRDSLADQLEVIEGWWIGPKPTYMKAIDGVFLESESIDPVLPFSFFRWWKPRRGFWGIGLVEQLLPMHIDINRTMTQIRKNVRYGNFQAWLESASKVKGDKLTNEPGAINYYRGQPPKFAVIEPVSAGLVNHLNEQIARAYALAGISMDSAAGINTLGADAAGIARREHYERESERFSVVSDDWMHFWMDCTEQLVRLGKRLGNRKVIASNDRNTIRIIDWNEIDLESDMYTIKVAPISVLPSLPSSKLAHVQELQLMGVVSQPGEVAKLLDWPDLDEYFALDRAMSDYLDGVIERILDDGEVIQPTSFQDNTLAMKKCQAAYLKALDDGVPDSNLRLLRDYMSHTKTLQDRAMLVQQALASPSQVGVPMGAGPTGQAPQAVTPQDGAAPLQ
jgi:hypothetical protein